MERDFLTIIEFDVYVERYTVQPLGIPWRDSAGQPHVYTPDVLVSYRRDQDLPSSMPHLLVEVKPREVLRNEWAALKPKLRAAMRFAKSRGWRFRVITEREIRTPYLENAKFLLPYLRRNQDIELENALRLRMEDFGIADPETLIAALRLPPDDAAAALAELWRLIASRRLGTDLLEPLTMRSRIWA